MTAASRLSSESASQTNSECPVGQPSAHRQSVRAIYSGVTCVLNQSCLEYPTGFVPSGPRQGNWIAVAVRFNRGITEGQVGDLLRSQECREVMGAFKQVAERTP